MRKKSMYNSGLMQWCGPLTGCKFWKEEKAISPILLKWFTMETENEITRNN